MSRFIRQLRKAALTMSLSAAALMAVPSAEATAATKNSSTTKSTSKMAAARVAPKTTLQRPAVSSTQLAPKKTLSLKSVQIPKLGLGKVTASKTLSSAALDKVSGGGVPGKLTPRVQAGGVPGKARTTLEGGGVPGKSLVPLSESRGVMRPTDFSKLDRFQKMPDFSSVLRGMHDIPTLPAKTGITFQGPGEGPSMADLIKQSQQPTRKGLQEKDWLPGGAATPTLPFQDQLEQAKKMSERVSTEVGAALGQFGLRDGRFQTPGQADPLALGRSSQSQSNEVDDIVEASLNILGLTQGPDIMSQGRGLDPRTAAWNDSPVKETVYDKNGVKVVVLENGNREVRESDGAMGKVVEKLPKGNIVYVVDNKDNLVVVGLPHDKNGNPTGEPKVAVVPPTENKKNPNPMAEDYRGQIDAEWMRRFNAKLKGAVDPHDEFGQPDVDIDKFIAGTIAASMSKVNPNPDAGPIDTSGGGRLPGDDLIIPEFKVHVPKTGKGPKPQIGPGGPAPRGLGGDSPLKAAALRGTALLSSSQSTMLNNQNDDTTGSPASSSSRANSSR